MRLVFEAIAGWLRFCFSGAWQPGKTILQHTFLAGRQRAQAGAWRAFRVRAGLWGRTAVSVDRNAPYRILERQLGLAAVGLSMSPFQAVVQITGDGFRVEIGALQNTLESAPHLQLMLGRYAAVRSMQVAQTAACNRLHGIEQRLARWLLMAQDRVDSESLPITHDFLATMLGTDRPTVSLAAGVLQRKKLIEYT